MTPVVYEAKGTSIISQMEFVRTNFGEEKFAQWVAALEPEAREIVEGTVLASSWYKGRPIVLGMRKVICDMFYDGDPMGARELGLFAAENGLRGVYKFFVRLGSPGWIATRATTIFSQYFKPGEVEVISREKTAALMRLIGFPDDVGLFEQTVAGFTEGALIISGAQNVSVEITKSYSKGHGFAEFAGTWD